MIGGVRRTFSSLSIYNYRMFWLGQLVSVSGTWMQTTAQAWLVLKLTNSPAALGAVTMLQFLPVTFLALFGGVIADRLPKRKILFCTQTFSSLQALTLATLVLTHNVQLWHIYALAFLLGISTAVDNPARQAFVVELVGKEGVVNAVALNSSLYNSARIIGPALGGIAINVFGIGGAFLANGLSYGAVLLGLALMRPDELRPGPAPRSGKVLAQLSEGVSYSVRTPRVLAVLLVMLVLGGFGYTFNTTLPLIAKYVLDSNALGLGILLSAMGFGSLTAALTVAYFRRTSQTVLLMGAAAFAVLLFLVGTSTVLPLTLGLLMLLGFSTIVTSSSANTGLQLSVPDELRGRVMSLYFMCFAGATPFGGMLVGVLADKFGVQPAIMSMASACLLGVLGVALYVRWTNRHQPEADAGRDKSLPSRKANQPAH